MRLWVGGCVGAEGSCMLYKDGTQGLTPGRYAMGLKAASSFVFSKNWNPNGVSHAQKALRGGWWWNPRPRANSASTDWNSGQCHAQAGNEHSRFCGCVAKNQGLKHVQQVVGPRPHSDAQPNTPNFRPPRIYQTFHRQWSAWGHTAVHQAEKP